MPTYNEKPKPESVQKHSLELRNRQELSLTGVREILSFDGDIVLLDTCLGRLEIEGGDMKIGLLDTENGNVSIKGEIRSICYRDEGRGSGHRFFGRHF